jgi:FkbM family methyltransferase
LALAGAGSATPPFHLQAIRRSRAGHQDQHCQATDIGNAWPNQGVPRRGWLPQCHRRCRCATNTIRLVAKGWSGAMSLFRQLKRAFIFPLSKGIPTVLVGSLDQWALPLGVLNQDSFIVSAGVGTSITFEEDLTSMFRTRIILLDPSPTGVQTMNARAQDELIEFSPRGLAKRSGNASFGLPDRLEEGSFKKGTESDGLMFKCVSLPDLLEENKKSKIDLLKIDVEGFEYEIIESMIENNIQVDIICVEIHHKMKRLLMRQS